MQTERLPEEESSTQLRSTLYRESSNWRDGEGNAMCPVAFEHLTHNRRSSEPSEPGRFCRLELALVESRRMDEKLAALKRLLEIVDILRGPAGCPWDKAQKMENMGRYLLEEASEVVDAIEDTLPTDATDLPGDKTPAAKLSSVKSRERVGEELG